MFKTYKQLLRWIEEILLARQGGGLLLTPEGHDSLQDAIYWAFANIIAELDTEALDRSDWASMYLHGIPKMSQRRIINWLRDNFYPTNGVDVDNPDFKEVDNAHDELRKMILEQI